MILSRNPSGDHFAPQHESAKLWPYRTTPLVLPGAKVKREPGPTESYLRHHPNPAVRAPPHHLDPELLIKQKVTNTVLERLATGDPNKQVIIRFFFLIFSVFRKPPKMDGAI
jgi:hypothetical protein